MELNLTEFKIRQFINNGLEFFYGRTMAQNGRVLGVRMVDSDKIRFAGKIKDDNGKEYMAETEFNLKGEAVGSDCSCNAEGRCRHTAALLFELMNSNGEKVGELSRNYVASKNLLNLFERHRLDYIKRLGVASGEKLYVEPLLYLNGDKPEIELYVYKYGKRKKKVEDIFEFTSEIDRNIGKAFRSYKYNIDGFSDDGKKILNFIYGSSEFKTGFVVLTNLSEDKSRFILSGGLLDGFFSLYAGKRVNLKSGAKTVKIPFEEGEPYARISIEAVENKARLKKNFKDIKTFFSGYYGYILLDGRFYKTTAEYAVMLNDLSNAFNICGGEEIVFGSADVNKLVDFVVPMLQNNNLIDNAGKVFGTLSLVPFGVQVFLESRGKSICAKIKYAYGDTIIDYNDKQAYREYRNDRAETAFKLLLESLGFYDRGSDGFIMSMEDNIYSFLKYGIKALGNSAEVFLSENFKQLTRLAEKRINIGVRYEGNLIEIDFDTTDINLDELKDVLNAYREKREYYRFSDGRFLSIDDNKMFLKFVQLFNLGKNELEKGSYFTNAGRIIAFDRLFDENEKSQISFDKYSRRLIERFNNINIQDYTVPSFYNSILRDYQKKGFMWLKALSECGFGGILADDMGLGKTIQVISFLYDKYRTETKPSLVVCPTSLIYNWEAELESYGGGLKYELVYGSKALREKKLSKNTQIFITSYDTLKRDNDLYKNREFAVIIADEAQFIKNSRTRSFQALTEIKGEVKFALTGTPFENRLGELWSVFEFFMPGYLGSARQFADSFEKPIMRYNDADKMKQLKKLISPFILRREKGDVLRDLPEKIESCRYTIMTDEQSRLYKAELLKARGVIRADLENNQINHIKILSEITRLRQICCHPSLFLEGYTGESGKLNYLMENMGDLISAGHKILVFSQFTSMLDIIKTALKLKGIDYYCIEGDVPAEKRIEYVNSFNGSKDVSVCLVSLKVGGTGLNLTGADVVIHYDQWWNPAVMEQASDRAHRFGQIRRVQVYNLIAKDSIEEKILKLQRKKKNLFNDVLNLQGSIIERMTKEDILDLFMTDK